MTMHLHERNQYRNEDGPSGTPVHSLKIQLDKSTLSETDKGPMSSRSALSSITIFQIKFGRDTNNVHWESLLKRTCSLDSSTRLLPRRSTFGFEETCPSKLRNMPVTLSCQMSDDGQASLPDTSKNNHWTIYIDSRYSSVGECTRPNEHNLR